MTGEDLSKGDASAGSAPGLAEDQDDAAQGRKSRLYMLGAAVVLALLAVVGVLLAVGFVDAERSRDLRAWQTRLGIIADTRAAAVRDWVMDQSRALRDVADNDSVRLLMTELSFGDWQLDQVPDGEGQREYIRIFLIST